VETGTVRNQTEAAGVPLYRNDPSVRKQGQRPKSIARLSKSCSWINRWPAAW
jgi:hypothetical protein